MTDIKTQVQGINPNVKARNIQEFIRETGNIYETINALGKRANQLTNDIKNELKEKLEDFATQSDTIEEVQENTEQIEISKFYEKLPNPAIIATEEYLTGKLSLSYRGETPESES